MIEFVIVNIDAVIGVLSALVLIGYAVVTRQWALFRASAYSLMLSAEKLMATKEGIEKMDMVLSTIWVRTPKWIRKLITEDRLEMLLQKWYDKAKNSMNEITY